MLLEDIWPRHAKTGDIDRRVHTRLARGAAQSMSTKTKPHFDAAALLAATELVALCRNLYIVEDIADHTTLGLPQCRKTMTAQTKESAHLVHERSVKS